jgi:hypothetical protein
MPKCGLHYQPMDLGYVFMQDNVFIDTARKVTVGNTGVQLTVGRYSVLVDVGYGFRS